MKICRILPVLFVCASGFLAQQALGQESPKKESQSTAAQSASPSPASETSLHIFRLKHVQAGLVWNTIQSLVGKGPGAGKVARVAIDPRGNSLIALADPEGVRTIQSLLTMLDTPAEASAAGTPQLQLRVLSLEYADPHEVMHAIRQLAPTGLTASHADERTKSLFVKGTNEALTQVRAVVQRLDVASSTAAPRPNVSLRIVWLVDKALAGGEAGAVPKDLNPAIDKLRKQVDIGELALAAQSVVTFAPLQTTHFESTATVKLKSTRAELHVSGVVTDSSGEEIQLGLKLDAKDLPTSRRICNMDTICRGVLQGHPVIIGMTTVESQPSVFVIEALPN
jgi:type II secretory pathway component GspD/PulD (secretin)